MPERKRILFTCYPGPRAVGLTGAETVERYLAEYPESNALPPADDALAALTG